MEGNNLGGNRKEGGQLVGGFFDSLYFKHYLISVFLWFLIVVFNAFSDRRDSPDIGFWLGVLIILLVPPFTALGSFLGRKFRDFTRPDFIMTSGASETFKVKVFWKFGPQVIGWFIAAMIVSNIVG